MDFGTWTVAVLVVAGGTAVLLGRRRPFGVLAILILAVPFRDFSTRWLNVHTQLTVDQVTAFGRWWFALILGLLAVEGARGASRLVQNRLQLGIAPADWMLILAVVVAVAATLTSDQFTLAFTSLRGYLQPLGVYVLARLVRPRRAELRELLIGWLVVGLMMAAFAIVQVVAWDEETFRAEGYVRQDGTLVVPYAYLGEARYLRPASFVSGPNELGLDMVVLSLLAAFALPSSGNERRWPLSALLVLFVAGLSVSVSRSALIGLGAAGLSALMLSRRRLLSAVRDLRVISRRRLLLASGLGVIAIVVLMMRVGMITLVEDTFRNLGRQYHVVDTLEAIQFLAQRPQGVGMGLVEPKGAISLIEAGGTYHVEGSLLQIAMEMGVWGLAIWLLFWGLALARIWRNWQSAKAIELQVLTGAAFSSWIGSLVAFIFLPLMQSISLMVWLWFLLGIGYASDKIESAWDNAPTNSQAGDPRESEAARLD